MAYDFSQVKILVVEDMPPMLTLTLSLLTMFGFRDSEGAKSVAEGFDLFRKHKHNLIITDWQMEPLNGLDFIKMVRRDPNSPDRLVPIILMTGFSDKEKVEAARDAGATEFLMKPYTAKDMYARITQIIERPRQYVEAGDFFGPDRRRRSDGFNGPDRRAPRDKTPPDEKKP